MAADTLNGILDAKADDSLKAVALDQLNQIYDERHTSNNPQMDRYKELVWWNVANKGQTIRQAILTTNEHWGVSADRYNEQKGFEEYIQSGNWQDNGKGQSLDEYKGSLKQQADAEKLVQQQAQQKLQQQAQQQEQQQRHQQEAEAKAAQAKSNATISHDEVASLHTALGADSFDASGKLTAKGNEALKHLIEKGESTAKYGEFAQSTYKNDGKEALYGKGVSQSLAALAQADQLTDQEKQLAKALDHMSHGNADLTRQKLAAIGYTVPDAATAKNEIGVIAQTNAKEAQATQQHTEQLHAAGINAAEQIVLDKWIARQNVTASGQQITSINKLAQVYGAKDISGTVDVDGKKIPVLQYIADNAHADGHKQWNDIHGMVTALNGLDETRTIANPSVPPTPQTLAEQRHNLENKAKVSADASLNPQEKEALDKWVAKRVPPSSGITNLDKLAEFYGADSITGDVTVGNQKMKFLDYLTQNTNMPNHQWHNIHELAAQVEGANPALPRSSPQQQTKLLAEAATRPDPGANLVPQTANGKNWRFALATNLAVQENNGVAHSADAHVSHTKVDGNNVTIVREGDVEDRVVTFANGDTYALHSIKQKGHWVPDERITTHGGQVARAWGVDQNGQMAEARLTPDGASPSSKRQIAAQISHKTDANGRDITVTDGVKYDATGIAHNFRNEQYVENRNGNHVTITNNVVSDAQGRVQITGHFESYNQTENGRAVAVENVVIEVSDGNGRKRTESLHSENMRTNDGWTHGKGTISDQSGTHNVTLEINNKGQIVSRMVDGKEQVKAAADLAQNQKPVALIRAHAP